MKHEQRTRHSQGQAHDCLQMEELPAALPDFQHAFAWHTDLCGLSEKVLEEYIAELRRARQQPLDSHQSRPV